MVPTLACDPVHADLQAAYPFTFTSCLARSTVPIDEGWHGALWPAPPADVDTTVALGSITSGARPSPICLHDQGGSVGIPWES